MKQLPRATWRHPWRMAGVALAAWVVIVAVVAVAALVSCASSPRPAIGTVPDPTVGLPDLVTTTTVPAPVTVAATAPTIATIDAAAVASTVAVRVDPPASSTTVPATWVRYDCESFRPLFAEAGLPFDYFGTVVAPRESHCDPDAYCDANSACHSPSDRSYGLLQINTKGALWGELQTRCGLTAREQLFDPFTNLRCGAVLFSVYGYKPWRT